MAAVDRDHLPEGVAILPEPDGAGGRLEPTAWVQAVRRAAPRRLQRSVAEELAELREHGEA